MRTFFGMVLLLWPLLQANSLAQGVRHDPKSDTDVATITFASGPGAKVTRGIVHWTRPAQGDGSGDQANVALPPAPPTRTAAR